MGEQNDVPKSDVPFATLDTSNVSAMQSSMSGEDFLRKPEALSPQADC